MNTSNTLPLIEHASEHGGRRAVSDASGTYSYETLLEKSKSVASALLAQNGTDLSEKNVAFLVPSSFEYVAVQWGIWRAGGVAVPLAVSHPTSELEYVLEDADPEVVIAHESLAPKIESAVAARNIRFLLTDEVLNHAEGLLPDVAPRRRALIIYTSGTTGHPKGAVTTHANIEAQALALIEAWGWTREDDILCVLPLHHVHGIVNILTCALRSGAHCTMVEHFDADGVWEFFRAKQPTLFMAVPTIYRRLIKAFEEASAERQREFAEASKHLRLMVSGSAALGVQTLERWREITGHTLLERYGMTELGMVLSNPLEGERMPGRVGQPLPGVEVQLQDERGAPVAEGEQGEICVRGPNVFLEYWKRPDETEKAFRNGWFLTGDIAVVENSNYRIVGRNSVDIIKTGGYKISALEVEEVLRSHEFIEECAVVGVPDADWGERVSVAAEVSAGETLTLDELKEWASSRLAPYKIPRSLKVLDSLPRNAMGKVTKPQVVKLFQETV
ncbi:MAG: acyl-CoA synthetase [Gemmatimonadota bacterium]|nr:acyl-CoA synthetase [Gemmatimonadota bacterium]MDH5804097.1 acyl-CoA synthetase [Gemmatimonadota bacterium]